MWRGPGESERGMTVGRGGGGEREGVMGVAVGVIRRVGKDRCILRGVVDLKGVVLA